MPVHPTDRPDAVISAMRVACAGIPTETVLMGLTDDPTEGIGLVMRIATEQAYRGHLARAIVTGLGQCLSLSTDLTERLETVLHEAIANAVIHGNLELSNPAHRDLDGFAAQEALIERLLAKPELATRSVTVALRWTWHTIEVMVSDEGRGYVPRPEHTARVGGGMFIVHAFSDRMAVCDAGRCLILGFRR